MLIQFGQERKREREREMSRSTRRRRKRNSPPRFFCSPMLYWCWIAITFFSDYFSFSVGSSASLVSKGWGGIISWVIHKITPDVGFSMKYQDYIAYYELYDCYFRSQSFFWKLMRKVVLWCFFTSEMREKIHNSTFWVKISV